MNNDMSSYLYNKCGSWWRKGKPMTNRCDITSALTICTMSLKTIHV